MYDNESYRQQEELIKITLSHCRLVITQMSFPKDAALSYSQELDAAETRFKSGASLDEVEIILRDVSSRIDQFSTNIQTSENPSSSSFFKSVIRAFSGILK